MSLRALLPAPRDWVALVLIALVVGVMGVLGVSYVMGQGWRSFDLPTTLVLCVAATLVAAVLLVLADAGLSRLALRGRSDGEAAGPEGPDPGPDPDATAARESRPFRILSAATPVWSRRSIALFALVMAVFWLPWLVANYPGGTYWDTYYQIFQCYPENHPIAIIPYAECYQNTLTDAWLCDHHPIFDTLIYGAFGMASDVLTGSWMAGVFAFVCLQGAAHVVAFTAAVAYLRRRGCPVGLCFFAYAFLCLAPFVSTWALCMVKDSLFGLFYIPYVIMLFEAERTRGASLAKGRALACFVAVGLLLCLTKKQGLYVVVPTALLAAFLYRPRKAARASGRHAAAGSAVGAGARAGVGAAESTPTSFAPARAFLVQALSCLLLMCVVLPYAVFPLLNVAPGGRQEVLGTLFQQTARHVTYYGDDTTPEEREAIDALLEYENLADQYTFNFQDEVKYRYKLDSTNEELLAYLKVWAAQGMRHPESYLASVMSIAGYYVAPCGINNIRMVTVDTHMGEEQRYMLYNPDELDWLRNGLDEAYSTWAYTPGVDLPLLMVVYVFWLPAALIYFAFRRRVRCAMLLLPALILLAFLIIAPVNDARYCVPLFNAAPLLPCALVTLLRLSDCKTSEAKRPAGGSSAND